ncbi:hypothetical protein JCM8097_001165 [Rhodosporidiobolus ruineniae]
MQPIRRSRPAAPLLAFPPSPPKPSLPSREQERPRSRLFTAVAFLPLVFIFALLGFATYAFLWSLCITYLLPRRPLKAAFYALVFLFLLFGTAGNVWQAYWRGGGVVPGAGEWKRRDEEAQLEGEGVKDEVGRFVLGVEEDEGSVERPSLGGETEGEGREEEALLGGEGAADEDDEAPLGRRTAKGRLQVKSDGTARFCRKCNVYKPDRAHHCSSCRRCVLKMDHHCPWLGGGCVGWANYKFFLLFLLYTGVFGLFVGATLFHELMSFVDDVDNGFELAPISWALAALLGCIFGSSVGLFGLYHLYLASKNRSTIEAMEHPTAIAHFAPLPPPSPSSSSRPFPSSSHLPDPPQSAAHRSLFALSSPSSSARPRPPDLTYKQRHRLSAVSRRFNVYDLGWRENLRQVFGPAREGRGGGREGRLRWYEWVECVMPWGWPPSDGQTFPINAANLARLREATEAIYAEAWAAAGVETATATTTSGEESGESEGESDEDGEVRRA